MKLYTFKDPRYFKAIFRSILGYGRSITQIQFASKK